MRSKLVGYVIALTVGFVSSTVAVAQPKHRNKGSDSGGDRTDKTIDKQSDWERKVMGDDKVKQSEMRKIAAAQKLADEAAKNPPPVAAPKYKDPNKEGARAKQETAMNLPIESDKELQPTKKAPGVPVAKKTPPPKSSTDDELGALVASSLAEERSADANAAHRGKTNRTKGGSARSNGKARAKSGGGAPSSLDKMFASGGN